MAKKTPPAVKKVTFEASAHMYLRFQRKLKKQGISVSQRLRELIAADLKV